MEAHPKIVIFGFWPELSLPTVPIFKYLSQKYGAIILTELFMETHIDLIITSVFGNIPAHLHNVPTLLMAFEDYNRWKIQYNNPYPLDVDYAIVNNNPENIPFNQKRLQKAIFMSLAALWHHPLSREPLYFEQGRKNLSLKDKTEFCSFVVGNGTMTDEGVKYRTELFQALNSVKHVHSRGGFMNNSPTGEKAPMDKRAHQEWNRKYKYSICMENMFQECYITEKLLLPYKSGSIPIYHMHESFEPWLNPDAMINTRDKTYQDVVDEIMDLEANPAKYEAKLRAAPFVGNKIPAPFDINEAYKIIDEVMDFVGFSKKFL